MFGLLTICVIALASSPIFASISCPKGGQSPYKPDVVCARNATNASLVRITTEVPDIVDHLTKGKNLKVCFFQDKDGTKSIRLDFSGSAEAIFKIEDSECKVIR